MRSEDEYTTSPRAERHVRERAPVQKMRRGTHSCTECRRRKVRCIYVVGQDRCKECRFRGSNCIEQFPGNAKASAQRTKSMRERISELEALVQTLLAGRATDTANQSDAFIDDIDHPTPITAANSPEVNLPPLIQLFDNHVITPANHQVTADETSHNGGLSPARSPAERTGDEICRNVAPPKARNKASTDLKTSKDEHTRKKLLNSIDIGNGLDDAFRKNELRWIMWRSRILANAPSESFADWAKNVIRDGSPADLGVLVLLLGSGSDQTNSKSLIPLVATLIISDDDYTTTLSGIECSLLLSDYHCRIGQPRRAWLAIQRGLASAQLIGLHRHCSSPLASGMLLQLHCDNQALGLLLGLSRGIDFHCDLEYPKEDIRFFKSALCAICNKYRTGVQGQRELSPSLVLELDQRLQDLILTVPKEWKELQTIPSDPTELNAPDINHDQILIQIHMQQLRTYLYQPLMLSSGPTPMYEISRIACLQSSRELLRLYHLLAQQSLFENALLDFTGFSAAMLIILNLLGYQKFQIDDEDNRRAPDRDEQDWKMVETTISILADRAKSKDNKVVKQSLEVLRTLCGIRESTSIIYPGCRYRFVVPFFGEILAQPGTKFGFMTSSNCTTSSNQATTVHSIDSSKDISPESAFTNMSGNYNIANARSPIIISDFSSWHASSTISEQSGRACNLFAQGSESIGSENSLNAIQSLDHGLGMQPIQYGQQWQYLSDIDLNHDWLFLTETDTSNLNVRAT